LKPFFALFSWKSCGLEGEYSPYNLPTMQSTKLINAAEPKWRFELCLTPEALLVKV
jgi:hypothetical protein